MSGGFDSVEAIVASATGESRKRSKPARSLRTSEQADDEFEPRVLTRCLADVEPEPVAWLWPERIPFGKLTLIVGDPGLGKSFLTLDIAARLSRGTPWPDRRDESVTPGGTILLSAEDDLADTIRPRLDAAEADVTRIHAITAVQRTSDTGPAYFNLDADLEALERCIRDTGARLVVVDPLSAYLGHRDSHRDADIRALLAPLADLAARHRCAVLSVSHLNKNAAGRAMYRAMGSLAFTAAARVAWLVGRDPDNDRRRLLVPIKANLITEPSGIGFEIIDGRVSWFPDPVHVDADALLASDGPDRQAQNDAADWLMSLLAVGSMPVPEIRKAAEADCQGWRTIERAKKALGVVSRRDGYGKTGRFTWELPTVTDEASS